MGHSLRREKIFVGKTSSGFPENINREDEVTLTSVSLECHVLTENVNKHPWRIILRNKLSQTDIHFKSKISAEEALGEGIMAIHRLVWSTCHLHPPVSNPRLVNPIQKHANH